MVTHFQGEVISALNDQDLRNEELLGQVIEAANDISNQDNASDVDMSIDGDLETHEAGSIQWGGKEASLQGTGGVALLEYAKDAIQTAVSNISGVGTNQIQAKKLVERKMTA
jgi:hypothetical protein